MRVSDDQIRIRSRYGILRDLLPVYSFRQLAIIAAISLFMLWLMDSASDLTVFYLLILWLSQYQTRPSKMEVSREVAAWFEDILSAERFYDRTDLDGQWRRSGAHWWEYLPHHSIAFQPTDNAVTVIAPRDLLDTMRAALELVEEREDAYWVGQDRPFEFDAPELETMTERAYLPAFAIVALCMLAWLWHVFSGGMADWGLSASALAQGRFETIFLHMFTHAGLIHLAMNMIMLVPIGGRLVARFGPAPISWLRFCALFFLSGLAGAAFFLALHPTGTVPMVGASGALYGLIGMFIRLPAKDGAVLSIRSAKVRRIGGDLIVQNLFLFGLLAMMVWSQDGEGGLAWEAHLGGFLFGLLVGPKFLPNDSAREETTEPLTQETPLGLAERS